MEHNSPASPQSEDGPLAHPASRAKKKPPTAVAQLVTALRKAILTNELAPRQRLVESEISQLYDTSRGTVRTALIALEHEGLVERIANRGARVRVVGIDEAIQIAEVRLAVESICVRAAARNMTDTDATLLRDLAGALGPRAEERDVVGFAALTHQIQRHYVQIAQQPVAAETLQRLRDRIARHQFRLTYREGRAKAALPFWQELVEALCARDEDLAARVLERHALNIRDSLRALAQGDNGSALP